MNADQRPPPPMGPPIGPQNNQGMRPIVPLGQRPPSMNPPIGRPGIPNPAIAGNA